MQIAARDIFWGSAKDWIEVKIRLDSSTGLTPKFAVKFIGTDPLFVDWGDGSSVEEVAYQNRDTYVPHTYPAEGPYTLRFYKTSGIGFRFLDGQPRYSYDACVISVVDYSDCLTTLMSAAFKYATNLERFIAPKANWGGQRTFAGCRSLREVELGEMTIFYDGTFEFCESLVSCKLKSTGTCWTTVWEGCSVLPELRLGAVTQFGPDVFTNCEQLADIWISDKTMDQVRQVAPSGNIISGYGAKYPWGAHAGTRFHCTDGVLTV